MLLLPPSLLLPPPPLLLLHTRIQGIYTPRHQHGTLPECVLSVCVLSLVVPVRDRLQLPQPGGLLRSDCVGGRLYTGEDTPQR